MEYVTKAGQWFDAGTTAKPVTDFWIAYKDWAQAKAARYALFEGIRKGKPDEEVCCEDEFIGF